MIRRGDRGATLVIVAVFAIVAVVMAAAVIDLGGLRAEKKEVTLSTDAAALAAVSVIDFSNPAASGSNVLCGDVPSTDTTFGDYVEDVADHYLTVNGESVLGSCVIFFGAPGTNSAYLTVTASDSIDYRFGKAAGIDGASVTGTSSARVGSASVDNVYPIGLCALDDLVSFVNDAQPFPQYFGGNEELEMDFGNSNCDSAGNHDQIDFGGNPPPGCGQADTSGQFCHDLNNGGYDGTVPPSVGSNPGGSWNQPAVSDPIEDLRVRAVHIWVPAVGQAGASGNPGTFDVDYLVEVVITDFRPTGSDKGLTLDVYQVIDYAYYQTHGLPQTTVNQQVRAHICATSADTSGCTNNPVGGPPAPPPPPPAPCDVDTVSTNPVATVQVDSAGELTAPLTVSATVADPDDCDLVTLEAVSSTASPVPGPSPTQSGSQFVFEYPAGTFFSPVNNTVFTMEVSEDGEVRNSSTSVTVEAPTCGIAQVDPASQTVPVEGNGQNRVTSDARSWAVSITHPELCGAITGEIWSEGDVRSFTGSPAAAASMTFTLPASTPIPSGKHNGHVWSVRIYNDGVLVNNTTLANTASLTTTAP